MADNLQIPLLLRLAHGGSWAPRWTTGPGRLALRGMTAWARWTTPANKVLWADHFSELFGKAFPQWDKVVTEGWEGPFGVCEETRTCMTDWLHEAFRTYMNAYTSRMDGLDGEGLLAAASGTFLRLREGDSSALLMIDEACRAYRRASLDGGYGLDGFPLFGPRGKQEG